MSEAFGGIEGIFKASAGEVRKIERIPKGFAEGLRDPEIFNRADEEIEKAAKARVEIVSLFDPRYPEELKEIYDPPILFYVRGKLPPAQAVKVAVVGSRVASVYGDRAARTISRELAEADVVVVSGMARGIDSAAHEGALVGEGVTLAVLGGGLARIYPPENRKLADRIVEKGAVISEYPMDMLSLKQHFPVRNRIISGLSKAVLVVEAKEKSGALITADSALEQGREVFAVPGNIDSLRSGGTNKLIKQGAQLATSAQDILEALNIKAGRLKKKHGMSGSAGENLLNDLEKNVLSLIGEDPAHVDEIIEGSGLKPAETMSFLSILEIKGFLSQHPGGYFVRK